MSQMSFADAEYSIRGKQARREIFWADIDLVAPLREIEDLIEPGYFKVASRRRLCELSAMV